MSIIQKNKIFLFLLNNDVNLKTKHKVNQKPKVNHKVNQSDQTLILIINYNLSVSFPSNCSSFFI